MNTLFFVVVVVQVLAALAIIGLVLLQHGKGADMGAAFGSGASGSLFGATGSSNFLSKSTAVAAGIFFVATLGLTFIGNHHVSQSGGVMDNLQAPAVPAQQAAPAAPAAPTEAAKPGDQSSQIPK
ncbi:preprotein translocase subunit SecG [Herbaspirillum rubrisubalbicans]|uniref:Protein-export membrane protein SecG n=2 Tax=Herbaspirillum rubrisubalbicans TaxID=80842 RepID=A0AAD0XFX9_9BURK|nr:preprotein translocase subunit SecG [Herbaspirillum rubrisubalbicans]ALU88845.1 Preprotein translocase subunit SecG protein [Herbaspirillum rubrisubalbicans M1]AYR23887.1 preprotein translocase subunit SecG [Herbaspirillum rubrisubalbicans]MCP1571781.1 preprotein translocase subunit SecG [Herbaspirillum rubrisubalbicans]QJQ00463.1 preprotein translocase subunit SecG [Herbaspirillum rubrisubalbicans Os34]